MTVVTAEGCAEALERPLNSRAFRTSTFRKGLISISGIDSPRASHFLSALIDSYLFAEMSTWASVSIVFPDRPRFLSTSSITGMDAFSSGRSAIFGASMM